MSDVLATPARERTYRVPSAVQTAAAAGHGFISDAAEDVSLALVAGAVTETQLSIITATPAPFSYRQYSEEAVQWASRIEQAIADRAVTASLQRIGYAETDDDTKYYGVESDPDSDILVKLLRAKPDDPDNIDMEKLSPDGLWEPYTVVPGETAVEMDKALTAALGQAILDGCDGLYLSYAEPVTFLRSSTFVEENPLVAAIDPNRDYIYAIVDAADTTAVIDAVKIEPGPIVYRRDNGQWTRDETLLDSLLSASPPPLVELSDDTLKSVLSQIDASKSNHLDVDPEGNSYLGESIEELSKSKAPRQRARGNQINDPVVAALNARYEDIVVSAHTDYKIAAASIEDQYRDDVDIPYTSLIAAAQRAREYTISSARAQHLRAAIDRKKELEARDQLLTIVAASNSLSAKAKGHHAGAERLRQYWLHGKGALKIKWGVSGDWRRCYRHLRKYMGVRAKGYCQLMHKRATGMYTGDKRNR